MLNKTIVAGPHVRDACKRHMRDLKHGAERGLVWKPDEGGAGPWFRFFEKWLRLNSGQFEGQPFKLNGWESFVIGSLFGWRREDGTRRFRTAYVETGKGSGKSPLAAGIGIGMMTIDEEPRAEVYAAAVKQDQAKVLFRDATAMVRLSPGLQKGLLLSGGAVPDNIAHMKSGSYFRPISSERQGRGQSGPKPHCVLLDEIHEHPTNAMIEFLSAGVKWRRQPLVFMITNSGCDRQTVCWEYHSYGIEIADGTKENDEFFAYICALDKGDDPFKDETCWIKANPSLPTIPGADYIRQEVAKAKGMPSKETLVRRLNFCEWTDAADAWIHREVWNRCQAKLDLAAYKGKLCYGGLDLALAGDLTAFVLVFPEDDGKYAAFSWFWMPGDRLVEFEIKDNMAPNYRNWRDQGFLQAPPGRTIDYAQAAKLIGDVCSIFNVAAIAYDRAKIDLLLPHLQGYRVPLKPHGQGFYKAQETGLWMPGSIERLEAAIIEEKLRVSENPVLTWNVASAVTTSSIIQPTDRYFSKRKASGRIDGVVALAMAMGIACARQPEFQMFVV